jgi:ABC-type Fe3+/spermidine/putrescine transport system ATPase subunit
MVGGFEELTGGRILLGDRDVTGLPPYRRDVNTVFPRRRAARLRHPSTTS